MYSTCLHCNKPLGANEVLETLPIGRRVAFDPAQGRLWVVCRHCAKWNLVPFDSRLESIEECERIYRDTPTRYSTGEIGLARHREGLDLVRVGPALRPEFAAWRYGDSYQRRRRKAMILGSMGVATAGVVLTAAGVALAGLFGSVYLLGHGLEHGWKAAINRKARLKAFHPESGEPLSLATDNFSKAAVTWEDGGPSLEVPYYRLLRNSWEFVGWRGTEFRTVGRRVFGGLNLLLGSRRHLDGAVGLLGESSGDLTDWLKQHTEVTTRVGGGNASWRYPGNLSPWGTRGLTRPYLLVSSLEPVQRLAVEMWLNEDIERTWLEGELKLLEREWREADRLAKITDDLVLSPEK